MVRFESGDWVRLEGKGLGGAGEGREVGGFVGEDPLAGFGGEGHGEDFLRRLSRCRKEGNTWKQV